MPSRLTALALALALLAAACSLDNDPSVTTQPATSDTSTGGPAPTTATLPTIPELPPTTLPASAPPSGDRATVIGVIDGDSIMVEVDGGEDELRLLGINAPEGDECLGPEARETLAGRLEGADVTLVAGDDDDRDQFDRLLRYVFIGGLNVNQTMVRNGFALALSSGHRYDEDFEVAEERAFREAAGMWAPTPCGGPEPQRAIDLDVMFDPPGGDGDDLNGEWVDIRNNGELLAEMGGWVLRDESSANRYVFPDGYQLFPLDQVRVHVGCGEDTRDDLYWCETRPVWNNGGDSALLFNSAGSLIARLRY